jgi:hypothetical protein
MVPTTPESSDIARLLVLKDERPANNTRLLGIPQWNLYNIDPEEGGVRVLGRGLVRTASEFVGRSYWSST